MGGRIFVRTISLLICKWDAILEDDDNNKKPLIRGFPKAMTLVLCYLLVLLHQSNPHDNLSQFKVKKFPEISQPKVWESQTQLKNNIIILFESTCLLEVTCVEFVVFSNIENQYELF